MTDSLLLDVEHFNSIVPLANGNSTRDFLMSFSDVVHFNQYEIDLR